MAEVDVRTTIVPLMIVAGVAAGIVGARLSSASGALVGTAAVLCVLAAAVAATRVESVGFPALAASLSMTCLGLAVLSRGSLSGSAADIAAAVFALLAAACLWLSIAGETRVSPRLTHLLFSLSMALGLLALPLDEGAGLGGASAVRLLALVFAADLFLRPRVGWSKAAPLLVATIAVVAGVDAIELPGIEAAVASLVAALVLSRWWRLDLAPSPFRLEPSLVGRSPRLITALGAAALASGSLLLALAGARDSAVVLAAGLAVGTVVLGGRTLPAMHGRDAYVRSLERTAREIARQAQIDGLTGLPNRQAFESRLAEETQRALRYRQPLALCFVDIDHFKAVNDTHGHEAGDEVLSIVADTLRATVRTIDVVCRYGGEEFVVIAPGTWTMDALVLAERLREAVSGIVVGGESGRLTISLGVAGLPEHADDAATLLQQADVALYGAKRSGRNRTHLARPVEVSGRG